MICKSIQLRAVGSRVFYLVTTENEIDLLVNIAHSIWLEHYPAIIGIKQVNYMLETLHSKDAIAVDIMEKGFSYYLIKTGQQVVGYIGLQLKPEELFLSKIYISSNQRGQGLGKLAMNFVKDLAQKNNLNKISLTVNRNNTGSIAAYYQLGFIKTGEICVDIGAGFKMDDYQMALAF